MTIRKKIRFIVTISLLTFIYCCQQSTPKWYGEHVIKNNVNHIYNPKTPILSDLHISTHNMIQSFGASNESDSLEFVLPIDISINQNHDIAILDNQLKKIFICDQSLNLIHIYGNGKGQGPKEFMNAYSVYLDDNRNAYLVDFTTHRLQIFYPHDEVKIQNLEIEGQLMGLTGQQNAGNIFILSRGSSNLVTKLNLDLTVNVSFGKHEEKGSVDRSISVILAAAQLLTSSQKNSLLLASQFEPIFKKYSDDGTLDAEIHYQPLYKLQHGIRYGKGHDGHNMLSLSRTCQDIATDENGFIYLLSQASKEGEQNVLLCFDESGRFLQKIYLPKKSYNSLAIKDGFLYLLTSSPIAQCEKYELPGIEERMRVSQELDGFRTN